MLRILYILALTICANVHACNEKIKNKQGILLKKKASYFFKGAKGELVKFNSRANANSDETIERSGILLVKPNAKATVVICHGFTCDKYDVSFLHLLFGDYNTLAFDFRAHGEDVDGQECTLGRNEAYDVIAAAKFVKNHPKLKNKPIIAYGFSMGAASAIVAQAQDKNLFDALILDCPFDSTDKLLDRGIDQLKINVLGYEMAMPGTTFLKNYAYTPYVQSMLKAILKVFTKMDSSAVNTNFCPVYPEEAIKHVTVPCFFIACINDDKAPEVAVRSVYDGARGFKRLWVTDGRRHYDPVFFKLHEYCYRVNKFIKNCISGEINKKKKEKITRDVVEEKQDNLNVSKDILNSGEVK